MATAKTSKPATPAEKHAARLAETLAPSTPIGKAGKAAAVAALRTAALKVWGDADKMSDLSLATWAGNAPVTVAGLFVAVVDRSARAYEKANGVDNDRASRAWEAEEKEYGAAAEYLAALFGLALDWPGLYPSMQLPPTAEHPNGRTEHGSTNVESVYRAFTWAEAAKVEQMRAALRHAVIGLRNTKGYTTTDRAQRAVEDCEAALK